MTFQSIRYFLMTEKRRSFTKAAEELLITQQTLSAQIANLEQELGNRLFERTVPLKLTGAGEIFLRYAERMENIYMQMQHEFDDLAGNRTGCLRIGVAHTRGHAILPQVAERFQTRYPGVEIRVQEERNDMLPKQLADGTVDLVIAEIPEKIPGVMTKKFHEEEIVLLLADELLERLYGRQKTAVLDAAAQDLRVLRNCPFLMNTEQDINGRIGRMLIREAGFVPLIRMQSENVETLLELCLRGSGACFCPQNLYEAVVTGSRRQGLHTVHFEQEDTRYWIRFGWAKQNAGWKILQDFINIAELAAGKEKALP